VPAGLLRSHRIAEKVWGRLVVHSGALGFSFEDERGIEVRVAATETVVIPPSRPHHLVIDQPVTFAVEFYRAAGDGRATGE
jgi:tellurite resistance-related uncharacterized protein